MLSQVISKLYQKQLNIDMAIKTFPGPKSGIAMAVLVVLPQNPHIDHKK